MGLCASQEWLNMSFLAKDEADAEVVGWFLTEDVGTKFEKILTLRDMIYLDGDLSSLGAKQAAWKWPIKPQSVQ
jgi:hypothetical protein